MKTILESFVARSWLAETDPRLRVVSAIVLILLISMTNSLSVLVIAATTIFVLAFLAGFTFNQLIKRLLILELFVLLLTLSLPFTTPGSPLFFVMGNPLSAEGILLTVMVMLRVGCSVILTLVFLTSLTTHQLAQAMSSLGVPNKLCWLLLMTIRYVHVLGDEYFRLRESMRARAFRPESNRHTWKSYAWLIGMLLVRSMKRSETVLQSMRCRGFTNHFVSLHTHNWKSSDTYYLLGLFCITGLWLSGLVL